MALDIPETADEAEAAAITAVFRTLAAEAAAEAAADEGAAEAARDPWGFTGRIETLQSRRVRSPANAPRDAWSAAGRTDRF